MTHPALFPLAHRPGVIFLFQKCFSGFIDLLILISDIDMFIFYLVLIETNITHKCMALIPRPHPLLSPGLTGGCNSSAELENILDHFCEVLSFQS